MRSNTYIQLDKDLLKSSTIIRASDGASINIDVQSKVLYTWFLDRYLLWSKKGNEFFDNQSSIAEANQVCERTIKRFVKQFSEFGLLSKGTRKATSNGFSSNNYKVVNIFMSPLYYLGVVDKVTGEIVKIEMKKRKVEKEIKPVKPEVVIAKPEVKPTQPEKKPEKKKYVPPPDDEEDPSLLN